MVIDLIVTETNDGYSAQVPSLSACDSWAHTEDEVIDKALELVRFYISLDEEIEIKVDRSYKRGKSIVYKLIFDKQ